MTTKIWMAVALILAASGAGAWRPCSALCQEVNSGIIYPNELYGGHSYQEWHAYYVDQKIAPLYGIPPSDFSSPDVHFLPITQDSVLEIADTIPAGQAAMLMVMDMLDNDDPVLDDSGNKISSADKDVEDWKKFAERGSISCAIDGAPVRNLKNYVFKNKLAQKITSSGEDHITYSWSIGIDLLMSPLKPGIHTIHVYSNIPRYNNYTHEAIYKIEAK
jgi:hypothetical protein